MYTVDLTWDSSWASQEPWGSKNALACRYVPTGMKQNSTWFIFVHRITKDNPLFYSMSGELTLPFGCERSSAPPNHLIIETTA